MIYDVRIERLEISALFDLQGARADLAAWADEALSLWPDVPNSRVETEGRQLCWLGAEHWLLRAPVSDEDDLLTVLRPSAAPDDISIVLISDSLAFWRITGPEADQIIAIASPLNIHPMQFGDAAATWTEAFGQRALILRVPGGFEMAFERSYAAMVDDYFTRITI